MNKNDNKRNLIIVIISITLILLIGVTISYAYISIMGKIVEEEVSINTGDIRLVFNDEDEVSVTEKLHLGQSITKHFSIENKGSGVSSAKIIWDNLVNTYLPQSLSYKLECDNGEEDWTYVETYGSKVPRSAETSKKILANRLFIPAKTKYNYRLTITLENLENVNQIKDVDATLSTKFSIEEGTTGPISEMASASSIFAKAVISATKEHITQIVFESSLIPKSEATYTVDLSANGDKSVMGYIFNHGNKPGYTLYIQGNDEIIANSDSSKLFNFPAVQTIEGLEYLNTSKVMNMSSMFGGCSKLKNLRIDDFDTANVTNMSGMFYGCSELTSLNVSNFNTSKVIDMSGMFDRCSKLITLVVDNFDTANVTNMSSMFGGCSELTSLNVSDFNTNRVTSMANMFYGCSKLKTLSVDNFDTTNVANMSGMFGGCSELISINVRNFNTSKVTDMSIMFNGCNKLTTLNVDNFDTSNVTDMFSMFGNCSSLTSLDLSNFITNEVADMTSMFIACSSLKELDISNFDTNKVNSKNAMFKGVNSSIKIKVLKENMKQWVIDVSSDPKLSDDNFMIL